MNAPLDEAALGRLAADAKLGSPSIVVRAIDGGDSWADVTLEPHLALYPASTVKTPLVACALVDVAAGRLSFDQTFTVTHENMTFNDAASPLTPGYASTLREIARLCIERSDNVATNMLFDIVGRERACGMAVARLGLSETGFYRKLSGSDPLIEDAGWDGVRRNVHSAADSARMFAAIALDAVPLARDLYAMLARQVWNEKLNTGLREGDRFAHKTGDTSEVSHDGGILTTAGGARYVVVVHTGMPSGETASARLGDFMRALREELGP